jgi:ataxin-3
MSLYHEKQVSSLCGVHALNNLLQGPAFGAGDLASIALRLDEAERSLLDDDEKAVAAAGPSHRVDPNTGDFSLDVLAAALEAHTASLVNCDHVSVAEAVATAPESEEGYLIHTSSHWFALRRVASLWWNVDSRLPRPILIASDQLTTFLSQLRVAGHTVHVVRCDSALPLPPEEAQAGGGSRSEGHEAVFHPLDYLLQYPPLDPSLPLSEYSQGTLIDAEDADAAAAAAEAEAIEESERQARLLQEHEWAGLAAAGGGEWAGLAAAGGGGGGASADPDAALARSLLAADLASIDQAGAARRDKARPAFSGEGGGWGFGWGRSKTGGSAAAHTGPAGVAPDSHGVPPKASIGESLSAWWSKKGGKSGGGGSGGGGGGSGAGGAAAQQAAPLQVSRPLITEPSVATPLVADALLPPSSSAASPPAGGPEPVSASLLAEPRAEAAYPSSLVGPPGAPTLPPAGSALGSTPAADEATAKVPDLLAMGFPWEAVHAAVEAAGGDVTLAQEYLLEGTLPAAALAPQRACLPHTEMVPAAPAAPAEGTGAIAVPPSAVEPNPPTQPGEPPIESPPTTSDEPRRTATGMAAGPRAAVLPAAPRLGSWALIAPTGIPILGPD